MENFNCFILALADSKEQLDYSVWTAYSRTRFTTSRRRTISVTVKPQWLLICPQRFFLLWLYRDFFLFDMFLDCLALVSYFNPDFTTWKKFIHRVLPAEVFSNIFTKKSYKNFCLIDSYVWTLHFTTIHFNFAGNFIQLSNY